MRLLKFDLLDEIGRGTTFDIFYCMGDCRTLHGAETDIEAPMTLFATLP